ncbi:hypothetical protein GCM10023208_34120 [Erythrobacter westpacificensis]|uniref:Uncharacterized protein n=1 Tax=Erythrobacter westpacificensis TaxID=1055231 RepID=A0ABP9KPH2_9SPHN
MRCKLVSLRKGCDQMRGCERGAVEIAWRDWPRKEANIDLSGFQGSELVKATE